MDLLLVFVIIDSHWSWLWQQEIFLLCVKRQTKIHSVQMNRYWSQIKRQEGSWMLVSWCWGWLHACVCVFNVLVLPMLWGPESVYTVSVGKAKKGLWMLHLRLKAFTIRVQIWKVSYGLGRFARSPWCPLRWWKHKCVCVWVRGRALPPHSPHHRGPLLQFECAFDGQRRKSERGKWMYWSSPVWKRVAGTGAALSLLTSISLSLSHSFPFSFLCLSHSCCSANESSGESHS